MESGLPDMEGGPDLFPQPVYLPIRQVIELLVVFYREECRNDGVVPVPVQKLEIEYTTESQVVGQPQEDLMVHKVL